MSARRSRQGSEARGAGHCGAALCILGLTALSTVLPQGLAGPLNKGPHGFSEILYTFSSATGNNGSAFAGITSGTPYYNGMIGIAMWIGRFFMIVPVLAIAGSLAAKKYTPETAGSFPTTGALWIGLLVSIILIVGGLTFLPSLGARPHRGSSRDDQRPAFLKA